MPTERVTITMPKKMVEEIDRLANNRSRFVVDAVRRELARQRREKLRLSLGNPHEETAVVAEEGIAEWGTGLPDDSGLLDPESGRTVRWRAGEGWSLADPTDEGDVKGDPDQG